MSVYMLMYREYRAYIWVAFCKKARSPCFLW